MAGEIERAELFANVDELMAWKKAFSLKQTEMIAWQAKVHAAIEDLQASVKTTLEGCQILMQTDTQLNDRTEQVDERVNIVNKRLRRIEEAVARLNPR